MDQHFIDDGAKRVNPDDTALSHAAEGPRDGEKLRNSASVFVTIFDDYRAREQHPLATTLAQLAEAIRHQTAAAKGGLPWLKLAKFGDQRSDKNCLRRDANVVAITGVEADFDGGPITFDAAIECVRKAEVVALLYSTPSNTDDKPHWRVLCPTSKPLAPGERDALMDRLNGIFGGGFDPASWTLSQSYYFGSVAGRPPVRVEVTDGEYIDLRPGIASISKPHTTNDRAKPRTSTEGLPCEEDGDVPGAIERGRAYLKTLADAGDYWGELDETMTYDKACKLREFGLTRETVLDLMVTGLPEGEAEREWLETKPVRNAFAYAQNAWGCDAPLTDAQAFAGVQTGGSTEGDDLFSTGWDQRMRDPKPIEEVIAGLVEKHCVAYMAGGGGLSKSRIAQQWGACVHTGTPVYGRQVQRATFVHVSYENGKDEDSRRQATLIRRLDFAPAALDNHVYCGWKGRGPLLEVEDSGDIRPTPMWEALEGRLRSITGHKFIVFDSAYNVFLFKGNAKINETAVQRAIDWLDTQMLVLDASGLMITHPSTAGLARGDNSGWSVAWVNRPRVRITIKAVDGIDTSVELAVPKRNNGPKGRPMMLHWADGLLIPDNEADQGRAIYDACVSAAKAAANGGTPLKQGPRGVPGGICDHVERDCGIRISPKEVIRQLSSAVLRGELIYRPYDKNKRGQDAVAGYFPAATGMPAEWPQGGIC